MCKNTHAHKIQKSDVSERSSRKIHNQSKENKNLNEILRNLNEDDSHQSSTYSDNLR